MDVHRLRTVSFNKKLSEKHVLENKISHGNESRHHESSKRKIQNAAVEGHHTNKQRISTNNNQVDPAADTKTKILHSRVKEMFRKPALTSSLEDFRKKSRHDTQVNIKVKQRNKPRSKSTRQRDMISNEKFRNTDDIDILYTSEQMKGMHQKSSKQKSQRKPKSIHVRKSSTELFSTPSVSRLRNNVYMYYQACKLQNSSKRKRKRTLSKQQCLRDIYPPEINTSTGKQELEDCTLKPLHFNTIDYSTGDKVENSTQQSRHDFSNLCGDRETVISATSIVVPMAYGDGSCTRINEAIDTDALVTLVAQKVKKTKKKGGKVDKKKDEKEVKLPCVESDPYPSAVTRFSESLIKGMKNILLVLTAIAWSPCIIIIFLCWTIVTPLTPEDIMAAEEIPTCPKCRSKFFAKVIQCVTRVYNKVMYTFEAVRKSLNIEQEEASCSRVTTFNRMKFNARERCGFTPEKSTKQYVLYYVENKGWAIKPMQTQEGICLKQKTANVHANDIPKSRPEKSVTFWDYPKGIEDDNEDDVDNENTKTTTNNDKPSVYEIKSPCICPVASQTPMSDACDCDHRDIPSGGYVTPKISRSYEREHTIRPCQHTGVRVPPLKSPRIASRRDVCLDRKRLDHQLPCPGKQKRSSPCTCKPDRMRTQKPQKIRICKCPKKKKKKKKKIKKTSNQTCFQRFKGMFKKLNEVVSSAEQIWGPKSSDCQTLYMHTLRNRPCFWIYKCCPKLYPTALSCSKMFNNCCQLMLYLCAACIWCPIFLCCYLCYVSTCQLLDCC